MEHCLFSIYSVGVTAVTSAYGDVLFIVVHSTSSSEQLSKLAVYLKRYSCFSHAMAVYEIHTVWGN